MYCKFCGNPVDRKTMRCSACGRPVGPLSGGNGFQELLQEKMQSSAPAATPPVNQTVQPAAPVVPVRRETPTPEAKKSGRGLALLIPSVLCLAACLVCLVFIHRDLKELRELEDESAGTEQSEKEESGEKDAQTETEELKETEEPEKAEESEKTEEPEETKEPQETETQTAATDPHSIGGNTETGGDRTKDDLISLPFDQGQGRAEKTALVDHDYPTDESQKPGYNTRLFTCRVIQHDEERPLRFVWLFSSEEDETFAFDDFGNLTRVDEKYISEINGSIGSTVVYGSGLTFSEGISPERAGWYVCVCYYTEKDENGTTVMYYDVSRVAHLTVEP